MTYRAYPFEHYCTDRGCGGEILREYPSGVQLVRRVAVQMMPQYRRLFDTQEIAEAWANKNGATLEFHAG